MNKLRDMLHDYSDILIGIIIVLLMFGVVTWHLGDWFNKDTTISQNPPIEENPSQNNQGDQVVENDENPDNLGENQSPEATPGATNDQPPVEAEEEPPIQVVVNETKQVTIPNGAPGISIAKILLENNLIENTQDFIRTAEELNLILKLKPGTFDIPTDASLETIVNILAGRK